MCDDEPEFLDAKVKAKNEAECKTAKGKWITIPRHGKCVMDVGTWTPKDGQKDGKVFMTS